MQVRYIKSATVVIEHNGVKVLCDPWLTEGIYYGSWFSWPVNKFTAADFQDVDYIYISHVHPDHCDENTLRDLPKNIPIIILDFAEKFLRNRLKILGFTDIREVPNRGELSLGKDFKVEVMAADDNSAARFARSYRIKPFGSHEKTLQIDSLAIFSGGGKVVVNSNDVPVGLWIESAGYVISKYEKIDLLLVSYAGAGPFPQAYMIPMDQMLHGATGAAYTFLSGTMNYIHALKPKYFMPYAGQYTLGGKLAWMNTFKGVVELDELIIDFLPFLKSHGFTAEMVLLDCGESFDVDKERPSKDFTPTDFHARGKYVKDVLAKKKFDYELLEKAGEDILPKMKAARETMWRKQATFNYYEDVDFYINAQTGDFYHLNFSHKEVKRVAKETYDRTTIVASLDPRLMNMILDRKANWNNAEIGSHVKLYDFVTEESAKQGRSYEAMPHHLMAYLQCPVAVKEPALAGG